MKNEKNAEFKFLEIPKGEDILAMLGSAYIKKYGWDDSGKQIERNHFHNVMEIGICRWGTGEVVLDKKRYPYKKGAVMVVPQNYPHEIYSTHGEESFWESIYIKPSVFLEKVYKKDARKSNRYAQEAESRPFLKEREEILPLVTEINLVMDQVRVQAYGYRECIKGLLFALLMEIIKINHMDKEKPEYGEKYSPQKEKKLAKALEYMEANYRKNLRVLDIAQAAYVSETYLRRLFAESCEMSPMQYLNLMRINAACKLMKDTDANINEIAYKVGFENMTTFINNFKKVVGCTPREWKQNNKNQDMENIYLRKE